MPDLNKWLKPITAEDNKEFIRVAENMIDSIALEEDEIGNAIESAYDPSPFIDSKALNEYHSSTTVWVTQIPYKRVSDGEEYCIVLWMQGRVTGEIKWSPRIRCDIKDKIPEMEPTCILSGPLQGVWVFFEEISKEDYEIFYEPIEGDPIPGRMVSIGSVTLW